MMPPDSATILKGLSYDIRSFGQNRAVRYIEVKRHATNGNVTLHYRESQTAHRRRGKFFIPVDHALSDPSLGIVQHPIGKGVEAVEKVLKYCITPASSGQPLWGAGRV